MRKEAAAQPEIAPVVAAAATWLGQMYSNADSVPRCHATTALAYRFEPGMISATMDSWLERFASLSNT
jgi:hypothetical protein